MYTHTVQSHSKSLDFLDGPQVEVSDKQEDEKERAKCRLVDPDPVVT